MEELNIIYYTITNTHPDFAKRVLTNRIYSQVILHNCDITASIAPNEKELDEFRIHPMAGNSLIRAELLKRTGHFLLAPLRDPTVIREIIMYYQIYLDPVIVTTAEHYLWQCDRNSLQVIVRSVGFPIGQELVEAQIKHNSKFLIDKCVVIKAMLEIVGVVNCLPSTPAVDFLLSLRSKGRTDWVSQLN